MSNLCSFASKSAGRGKSTHKSLDSQKFASQERVNTEKRAVNGLDIVNKEFVGIFNEMNAQLSQCKL